MVEEMNQISKSRDKKNNLATKLRRLFGPQDREQDRSAALELGDHKGFSGHDIVALSTQDWQDLWTRKQRFMLQFARQGNRVLYVESQFHWLTYFRRFRSQWRRVYLFLYGPREIERNLFIYTPPLLLPAFQIFPILGSINNFALGLVLKFELRELRIKKPYLWLYSHFNAPLIRRLKARRAIYECVDEFSGARGLVKPEVVRAQEAKTLQAVDVTIVTAPGLKDSKEKLNSNIHIVPNAADVAHFAGARDRQLPEPNKLSSIPHPRLIFVGGIAYWVNLGLLHFIAKKKPGWQIVMVGPVMVNVSSLADCKNIHFLGRQSYNLLPRYLAWCDLALNPYRVDSVAENCSPLKLYEYLAAGLPVVSTEMPEARRFPGLIEVAAGYGQFIEKAEKILGWNEKERQAHTQRAQAEARKHSWESRFLEVEKIATEALV